MSASSITVTVGMCVKNSELTIKDALLSVINQSLKHSLFELVIIDGNSRDQTLRIVQETLASSDLHPRLFIESQGLPQARQMVVDKALGKYIVWVDGDMILSRNFLADQVQFMENNPSVGIAKGKYASNSTTHESVVATLENTEFLLNTMVPGETSTKVLGTSGCIYRTAALRGIGGFDFNVKGVGEDMDVENRVRDAGWSLHITSSEFYETRRQSWKGLWNEYFWHGSGGRYLFQKNSKLFDLHKMVPPVAVVLELFRVPRAYRLTRKKAVLLLPLHYAFKRVAWISGFLACSLKKN
jgi:glycosyltransferase involved in cell wall biosynthesis